MFGDHPSQARFSRGLPCSHRPPFVFHGCLSDYLLLIIGSSTIVSARFTSRSAFPFHLGHLTFHSLFDFTVSQHARLGGYSYWYFMQGSPFIGRNRWSRLYKCHHQAKLRSRFHRRHFEEWSFAARNWSKDESGGRFLITKHCQGNACRPSTLNHHRRKSLPAAGISWP